MYDSYVITVNKRQEYLKQHSENEVLCRMKWGKQF